MNEILFQVAVQMSGQLTALAREELRANIHRAIHNWYLNVGLAPDSTEEYVVEFTVEEIPG
jgi:hypothetical protein